MEENIFEESILKSWVGLKTRNMVFSILCCCCCCC